MNRATSLLLLLGLAGLIWTSHRLAGIRIYQVDECENIYVAKVLASGHVKDSYAFVSLLHFPLSWINRGAATAVDWFVAGRFLMLELFWLNVLLIALGTGEKLFSLPGLIALAGAATLVPLWDYGFEIRHDNLLLSGLLLLWCVARVRPAGMQSYVICGILAVVLQFVAFKAFVYTIPISLCLLAFPPGADRVSRWRLALAWGLGALVSLLALRIAYGQTGVWDLFVSDLHRVSGDVSAENRFAPWPALWRLLWQTPLVLAFALAGVCAFLIQLRSQGKEVVVWDGELPEIGLFLLALFGLLINPTPFPYNLLNLVPFLYLVGYRYAANLCRNLSPKANLVPAFLGVVVFTHLVPFTLATHRHFAWTNFRQERLMRLAETLTQPATDAVYDGVGLVPTRSSIGYWWFLHSFNIKRFTMGSGPRVSEMLAARPAAVFIPNYRTDWLSEADHEFIRQRYVSLADDFWVLGKVLSAGGGTFEIHHAGRYRISTLKGSDLWGTYPVGYEGAMTPEDPGTLAGTIDGEPLSDRPVQLTVGVHGVECASDCQPAVVWMGPTVNRVHRVGPGDHRTLFVNWY